MNFSHIIWDFNGTILDDVKTCIECINEMLLKRNIPVLLGYEDYYRHFKFPIIDYYKSVGFDFNKEPFDDVLAPEWVDLYLKKVKDAKIREGALEAINFFSKYGLKQVVISATEYCMLKKQLTDLKIVNLFDDFIGLDNIHAKSKIELSKNWFACEKPKKALFIGDTLHDLEVANSLSCDCVLISGGHQSEETLKSKCKNVFSDYKNIIDYVVNY
ncbi:MAG: HAD family phosphatase [Clostridia bacterium]|nr:HAD family phosphatase [Clostridia bacterium]